MKKKKKRERKKEFRGKGKKKKKDKKKKTKTKTKTKKPSVGFKPVRLFLLVSCLCNGRGWLEGLVSLFSLPGSHSSLFCKCGPWQSISPLISQSSRFGLWRVRAQQGNPAALGLWRYFVPWARSRRTNRAARAWNAGAQVADSAALGLGHSPAALYLENRHPAGPVLGERAQPAEPQALCLGARSSRPGLESLGRAGPPWDWITRHSVPRFWACGWSS